MISPEPTPIPSEPVESAPQSAPLLDLVLWAESEEGLSVLLKIVRPDLERLTLPHLQRTREQ